MGKDFHLNVAEGHWLGYAQSLVPGGGTVAWSLCNSITWGQRWQRLQRSWRWQWWLRLLGSSEAKTAGVLLFFFWLMGGSSSCGDLSWHQILCACTLSGIRTGILELGTHRTTTAPGSWGTGVLAMATVNSFLRCRHVEMSHRTGSQLSGSWNSDLVLGDGDAAVAETLGWQGAAVAWVQGTRCSSITPWGRWVKVRPWPQGDSCRIAAAWFWCWQIKAVT